MCVCIMGEEILAQLLTRLAARPTTDKQAKPYLFAKDYADFMKIITCSKNIDKLEEMRFHIIKEIMTARHIEDMKGGEIKGGAVNQGHLGSRNLSKFVLLARPRPSVHCQHPCSTSTPLDNLDPFFLPGSLLFRRRGFASSNTSFACD
jgi:hypothetical protein